MPSSGSFSWKKYECGSDFGFAYIRISDEYKKFQRLGKQRDLEAWEMYPSMVNAYFNPPANEVCFTRKSLEVARLT